jgi:TolB protein
MLSRFLYFFIFFNAITISSLEADSVIDLGQLNRSAQVEVIPVAIEGSPRAKSAFKLHGGYTLVEANQAAYIISFKESLPHTVMLEIASGSPRAVQYRQTFSGAHAFPKACDAAVLKTSGKPGFYCSQIAFVSTRTGHREIYSSDLLLTNIRQLTSDRNRSITPHWSADGKYIIYTGYYRTGFPDLFKINMDTGARMPFATYKGTNTGGTFSPCCTKVAMILSSSNNPELYISDSMGREPRRITKTKALEASPVWSPDGQKILFTSDRNGGPQLFIYDVRKGTTQHVPTKLSGYCAEGAWNPVYHNLIAFTGTQNRGFKIGVYDLNKKHGHFIEVKNATKSMDYIEPCWLPDGRHLVVTGRDRSTSRLYVLDSLTGQICPLHDASQLGSTSQASVLSIGQKS